jgi:hypothetical protein
LIGERDVDSVFMKEFDIDDAFVRFKINRRLGEGHNRLADTTPL